MAGGKLPFLGESLLVGWSRLPNALIRKNRILSHRNGGSDRYDQQRIGEGGSAANHSSTQANHMIDPCDERLDHAAAMNHTKRTLDRPCRFSN
ncbi:hypothetical protein D5086_022294 [Populus alba]|uniref:Uncharacterized protein n=1 Tax=Populus alba TaxID=43335 RepID=A0ACC4BFI6_POPAL